MIQHQSPGESDFVDFNEGSAFSPPPNSGGTTFTSTRFWKSPADADYYLVGCWHDTPEPVSNRLTFALAVAGCVALAAVVWLCWRCL